MKYFAIAPIAHLDLIKEEKHHMVITPFLKIPEVKQFYKEQKETGATIMLDNGEFEDVAITNEEYVDIVEEIEPNIICLPDYWKNPRVTITMHEVMLKLLKARGLSPTCMFIPHGNHLLEYIHCTAHIVNNILPRYPKFECIMGLTFAEWGDTSGIVRPFLSHHLMEFPGMFHFLGLYNTKELWTCSDKVVSVDSSFPFKAALQNKLLRTPTELVITDKFDFHAKLDAGQIELAKINLKVMKYLAEVKPKENPFEVLR